MRGRPSGHKIDWLCPLRNRWKQRIVDLDLESRCQKSLVKGPDGSVPSRFSDHECELFRQDLWEFLQGEQVPAWLGVQKGQPIWLGLLSGLLHQIRDVDTELPALLSKGVFVGFGHKIRAPGLWPVETRANVSQPLVANETNWKSAMSDPCLTDELIRMEIQNGWLEEWKGSWEDAVGHWNGRVAVSKIAAAFMFQD